LLKAAWNLKNEKELIIRDTKICPDVTSESHTFAVKCVPKNKYLSRESFLLSQRSVLSKLKYAFKRGEQLPKSYQ
jgi:hypothetical protein